MTDDATRAMLARNDVRYFVQKATKWNDCAQELANELKVNKALNAMAARIAELEQDAKRWQFIAQHSNAIMHEADASKVPVQIHFYRDVPVDWPSGMSYADNLGRQIDAAMQEAANG